MKRSFELTEADIKDAIVKHVFDQHGVEILARNITLTATENRGQFDQPGYGHVIAATAREY